MHKKNKWEILKQVALMIGAPRRQSLRVAKKVSNITAIELKEKYMVDVSRFNPSS